VNRYRCRAAPTASSLPPPPPPPPPLSTPPLCRRRRRRITPPLLDAVDTLLPTPPPSLPDLVAVFAAAAAALDVEECPLGPSRAVSLAFSRASNSANTRISCSILKSRKTLAVRPALLLINAWLPSARKMESGLSVRSMWVAAGPTSKAARRAGSSKPRERTAAASSQK
jgi:hypothetical protein